MIQEIRAAHEASEFTIFVVTYVKSFHPVCPYIEEFQDCECFVGFIM
jgi:hypothetical protein